MQYHFIALNFARKDEARKKKNEHHIAQKKMQCYFPALNFARKDEDHRNDLAG